MCIGVCVCVCLSEVVNSPVGPYISIVTNAVSIMSIVACMRGGRREWGRVNKAEIKTKQKSRLFTNTSNEPGNCACN